MRLYQTITDFGLVFATAGIAAGIASIALSWNRTWSLIAIMLGVATIFTIVSAANY